MTEKKSKAGRVKSAKLKKYDMYEKTVSPEALKRFRAVPQNLEYQRKYEAMVQTSGLRKGVKENKGKMKNHIIKIMPEYFAAVRSGQKRFEIRKDDRDYQVGDTVQLAEYDGQNFTGNFIEVQISYVLRDCRLYGLMSGYCVFCW